MRLRSRHERVVDHNRPYIIDAISPERTKTWKKIRRQTGISSVLSFIAGIVDLLCHHSQARRHLCVYDIVAVPADSKVGQGNEDRRDDAKPVHIRPRSHMLGKEYITESPLNSLIKP